MNLNDLDRITSKSWAEVIIDYFIFSIFFALTTGCLSLGLNVLGYPLGVMKTLGLMLVLYSSALIVRFTYKLCIY